jgi:uncharacterized membrane protein YcjF (UPF0283 family)
MMPTIGVTIIAEFLKLVADEIVSLVRWRKSQRQLAAAKKKAAAKLEREKAEAFDVYCRALASLKKSSKIPENPYGK